ncbi:hypothetical protein VR010_14900 [Actinomycetaceae bacterium L2_0104]
MEFGIRPRGKRFKPAKRDLTPTELANIEANRSRPMFTEEQLARMAAEKPTYRPACPSGKHDTDNNGICYTCGKYIAAGDAGRFI